MKVKKFFTCMILLTSINTIAFSGNAKNPKKLFTNPKSRKYLQDNPLANAMLLHSKSKHCEKWIKMEIKKTEAAEALLSMQNLKIIR